jgi:hypothetical protein
MARSWGNHIGATLPHGSQNKGRHDIKRVWLWGWKVLDVPEDLTANTVLEGGERCGHTGHNARRLEGRAVVQIDGMEGAIDKIHGINLRGEKMITNLMQRYRFF